MVEGEGLRVYHKEGGRVREKIRRQPKGGGREGEGDGMGKGSTDTRNL